MKVRPVLELQIETAVLDVFHTDHLSRCRVGTCRRVQISRIVDPIMTSASLSCDSHAPTPTLTTREHAISMFRKPRDSLKQPEVGRPPSPGSTSTKSPFTLAIPPTVPPPSKPSTMAPIKTKPSRPAPSGKQSSSGNVKKAAATPKTKPKPNGNIMSFFKKEETGLFVAENGGRPAGTASPYFEKDATAVEDLDRFNEVETPSKRRRLSGEDNAPQDQEGNGSLFGDDEQEATTPAQSVTTNAATKSGPFMEDSDSEDDEEERPGRSQMLI
jgi:DNA cross-link repair 1A protein